MHCAGLTTHFEDQNNNMYTISETVLTVYKIGDVQVSKRVLTSLLTHPPTAVVTCTLFAFCRLLKA